MEVGNDERRTGQCIISELRQQDVLLGRGTGPNEHHGNRIFRSLVKERKDAYVSCANRHDKDRLVMIIIQAIHDNGGRFLKKLQKVKGAKGSQKLDHYKVADQSTVMEKTRQTFQYFRSSPSVVYSEVVSERQAAAGANPGAPTTTSEDDNSPSEHTRNGAAQELNSMPRASIDQASYRSSLFEEVVQARMRDADRRGASTDGMFAVMHPRSSISPQDPQDTTLAVLDEVARHSSMILLEEAQARMRTYHRALYESGTHPQGLISVVDGVFPTTVEERTLLPSNRDLHASSPLISSPTSPPHQYPSPLRVLTGQGNPHHHRRFNQTSYLSSRIGVDGRWQPPTNHLTYLRWQPNPIPPAALALIRSPRGLSFVLDCIPADSLPREGGL